MFVNLQKSVFLSMLLLAFSLGAYARTENGTTDCDDNGNQICVFECNGLKFYETCSNSGGTADCDGLSDNLCIARRPPTHCNNDQMVGKVVNEGPRSCSNLEDDYGFQYQK